jgi:hypothetical protein
LFTKSISFFLFLPPTQSMRLLMNTDVTRFAGVSREGLLAVRKNSFLVPLSSDAWGPVGVSPS